MGAASSGEISNPPAVVAGDAYFVKALRMNVQNVDEVWFPPALGELVIECSTPKTFPGVVFVAAALGDYPIKIDGRMM